MTARIIPYPMPNSTRKINSKEDLIDWVVREFVGTERLGHSWTYEQAVEFGGGLWEEFQNRDMV